MNINTQYASDNYWDGNDPRSIMLHTTYGDTVIGAVDTLKARGLSYNYIIKHGTVYELVPFAKSAWHAGVVSGMNLRSRAFYRDGKGPNNPNRHSVGIAFAQPQGTFILPDEDIDAAVELLKFIGSQTGYRYNANNIFYHKEVTSYKPVEVQKYRELVVEAIVGDKDDKDAEVIGLMKILVQLLQQYLAMLVAKQNG